MTAGPIPSTPDPKSNQAARPESSDPWIGHTLKKYTLSARLGRGGMGVVYLGEDTVLKRIVAIKMVSKSLMNEPEMLRRFHREARAAARLQHANVASLYDIDEDQGVRFLVMEFVPGPTAQQLIEKGGLPWRAATQIVADACRGLAAAHAAALIHRDIKPGNIFVSHTGAVKLGDFGLAKETRGKDAEITAANQVLGTPQYMSPEQGQNGTLDARSDLYSLGATYYALLTGEPPYQGKSHYAIVYAHASMPIPDPRLKCRALPEACVRIVRRALAKRRGDRYDSASEMQAHLEAMLGARREDLAPLAKSYDLSPIVAKALRQRMNAERMARDSDAEESAPSNRAVPGADERDPPRRQSLRPGKTLGRFLVGRELGRTRFALAYLAFDPQFGRDAVLKIPRLSALPAAALRERFHCAARAAAKLEHANLVPVFESGEAGEFCYLLSAYSPGPTLATWLANRSELATAQAAAQVIVALADAVQYAHQQKTWHGDLKPANILLVVDPRLRAQEDANRAQQGMPSEAMSTSAEPLISLNCYVPQIIDFGMMHTLAELGAASGTLTGSPNYLAPEQMEHASEPIDHRMDIYALGAILYELLAGRPPFHGDSDAEVRRQVQKDDPVPLCRLRPSLPRDLETICRQCLRKDPKHRYASAADLAADLKRFLAGTPIVARPRRGDQAAWKWLRRRPAAAAMIALMVSLPMLWTPAVTWLWQDAVETHVQTRQALHAEEDDKRNALADVEKTKRALAAAVKHGKAAESRLTSLRVAAAQHQWLAFNVDRAAKLLDECPEPYRQWEWHYLNRLCRREPFTLRGNAQSVAAVAFSPDGSRIACGGRKVANSRQQGVVEIWGPETGKALFSLDEHQAAVTVVAFHPSGDLLASADAAGAIRLWDTATGKLRQTLLGHAGSVTTLSFHPGGARLASAGDDNLVRIWVVADGTEFSRFHEDPAFRFRVENIAYSPDGKTLATGGASRFLKIWDPVKGEELFRLGKHRGSIHAVAFRSDGKQIASASSDKTVGVWDLTARTLVHSLRGHSSSVEAVAFAPDGKSIASGSGGPGGGEVRLWNAGTGEQRYAFRGHRSAVHSLSFRRDGRRLASGGSDAAVTLWDPTNDQEAITLRNVAQGFAFSRDSKRLATVVNIGKDQQILRFRDLQSGQVDGAPLPIPFGVNRVCYGPDGANLAAATSRLARVWDLGNMEPIADFKADQGAILQTDLQRGAITVATVKYQPTTVTIRDARTNQVQLTLKGHAGAVHSLRFSPDRQTIVTASTDKSAIVWDAHTGSILHSLHGDFDIADAVFSNDGKKIATAGHDGTVRTWDAASGRLLQTMTGHRLPLRAVVFSADDCRLASASSDGDVKLWDPQSGQEVLTLTKRFSDGVADIAATPASLAFSPDGLRLAAWYSDSTIRVWDATPLRAKTTSK